MSRYSYPIIFLLFILLLYLPILFAGFAGDDIYQLVRQPFFHEFGHVISVFGQVIASPTEHTLFTGFFYRPLTYAVYTVIYVSFNVNPLPFHIIQLVLYSFAVYLLYIFFKQFFSKRIAFLLACVFLIHPANNELAAYIAALSDTLCLILGVGALILLGRTKQHTGKQTLLICALLFLSLLAKETGVLFVLLTLAYAVYKKTAKRFLFPFATVVSVYLLCRANASSHVMFTYLPHPVTYRSFAEHIFLSVQIAFAIVREIIVPTRDAIKPHAFEMALLPTLKSAGLLSLFIGLCVISFFWLRKHSKKYTSMFLFFSVWIIVGILFFAQIIPLEVLFAERWLYITEIGLLGLVGILLSTVKLPKTKWATAIYLLLFILLCCFVVETFLLNTMWLNWQQHFHNL